MHGGVLKRAGSDRKRSWIIFWITLVLLLAVPAAEAGPQVIVDFSGTPVSGSAPLTVSFRDQSAGSPAGRAWYFGDETYREPWTLVNGSLGTPANKSGFKVVATPDGSIILMGGCNHGPNNFCYSDNETWRSEDYGRTWTLVNASSGWSIRSSFTSVAMPDNSILLMGGYDGNYLRDVWVSGDHGSTWTLVNASGAPWHVRADPVSVVLSDGSIVITGGWYKEPGYMFNDTWRSTDQGKTWVLMNASSGWIGRIGHTMAAIPNRGIMLMGGDSSALGSHFTNETWQSSDAGRTWMLVNPGSGWLPRTGPHSVTMPDGSILLMGGNPTNTSPYYDVWRTTNYGRSWRLVNSSPGWSGTPGHNVVAMPDSSIILIKDGGWYDIPNEIWRFMPAGSTLQKPAHTYRQPGMYQVSLQAYNDGMYNSTRKPGYIQVNWALTKGSSGGGVPLPPVLK